MKKSGRLAETFIGDRFGVVMKVKRLFVLLIGIAFFIALITSCLFIFSIKTVKAEFNISESFNESSIKETLDEFSGKNLLFFDEEQVNEALNKFTNVKVLSVEKVFPNVLSVKLVEREIAYSLTHNNATYLLDKEGFIVDKVDAETYEKDGVININLQDVKPINLIVGSNVSFDNNELFYSAIEISETVLDNVESLGDAKVKDSVESITVSNTNKVKLAIFKTSSGVSIRINKPDEDGENKAKEGFKSYHELINDYYKTYQIIDVTKNILTGKIDVVWTSGG